MKSKTSGLLISLCLLLFLLNHHIVDWEGLTRNRAEDNLLDIITSQRNDLILWSKSNALDESFRKRKLCKGRLLEWSDDRPFDYSSDIDSIGLVVNKHGIFLYQRLVVDIEKFHVC